MVQRLKEYMVGELKNEFQDMDSCVVLDFTGMSANETAEFRLRLRKQGIRVRVVHNRLAARALNEAGVGAANELLSGQSAIIHGGDDAVILCRTVREWMRESQKGAVRGGLLDGRKIDAEGVEELSKVPPLKELYAQMAGLLMAPIVRLAGSLQAVYGKIGIALGEIRKQKEDGAGSAPAQS